MNWKTVLQRYYALSDCRDSGAAFGECWQQFREAALANRASAAPSHLRRLIEILEAVPEDRRAGLRVLDHGCGGGQTLLYFLALGYEGIYGANVQGKCEGWNRLLTEVYGITEKRFFIYDGLHMPLPDDSIDVVFSQQVVEHVQDQHLDAYYIEEQRVLRDGGLAYHQVPHRLSPYDSHTRLWLVHYFPKPLRRLLYVAFKRDADHHEKWVHLRWPWSHMRRIAKYIGPSRNLTAERLRTTMQVADFDGSIRLRNLIGGFARNRVVGRFAIAIFSPLMMLETLSSKRSTAMGAGKVLP